MNDYASLNAAAAQQRERELLDRIGDLKAAMNDAANTCDAWAKESREGGWSTHQVQANFELANKLRRAAAGVK